MRVQIVRVGAGDNDLDKITRVQIPTALDDDLAVDLRSLSGAAGEDPLRFDLVDDHERFVAHALL